ncbi:MAG: CopG family transcriptional regulator [Parvibaculum sp.]|nr:CopG family transcriptional regulator [Parvibaculum sp.]
MIDLSRRKILGLAAVGVLVPLTTGLPRLAFAAQKVIDVARSPNCGCCGDWIEHMRSAGFAVNDRLVEDLAPLKARLGVPADLQSCHTGVVEGYAIEGHVPAEDVLRLLRERPSGIGLAVPGMPLGSPGMEVGDETEPYDVILFSASRRDVFARH